MRSRQRGTQNPAPEPAAFGIVSRSSTIPKHHNTVGQPTPTPASAPDAAVRGSVARERRAAARPNGSAQTIAGGGRISSRARCLVPGCGAARSTTTRRGTRLRPGVRRARHRALVDARDRARRLKPLRGLTPRWFVRRAGTGEPGTGPGPTRQATPRDRTDSREAPRPGRGPRSRDAAVALTAPGPPCRSRHSAGRSPARAVSPNRRRDRPRGGRRGSASRRGRRGTRGSSRTGRYGHPGGRRRRRRAGARSKDRDRGRWRARPT